MIPLLSLVKEFQGKTILQQEEHVKALVGAEVELVGLVGGVDARQVWFHTLIPQLDDELSQIAVTYNGDELRDRFLRLVQSDELRLVVRLQAAKFTGISKYEFEVMRVLEHRTFEQRQAALKAQERSGCFVATAAYGKNDPNLAILRAYRDLRLERSFVGRAAVRFYYCISPPIASFIVVTARRRAVARAALGPIVRIATRRLAAANTTPNTACSRRRSRKS